MAHAMNSHISGMIDTGHQGIMEGGCIIPPGGHPHNPHSVPHSIPNPFSNPHGGFHFQDIGHMGYHHNTNGNNFVWGVAPNPTHPPAIS